MAESEKNRFPSFSGEPNVDEMEIKTISTRILHHGVIKYKTTWEGAEKVSWENATFLSRKAPEKMKSRTQRLLTPPDTIGSSTSSQDGHTTE